MANRQAYALFIIDPGGTSGWARARVDIGQPTVAACLRRAYVKGNLHTGEVTGTPWEQAWAFAPMILDYFFNSTQERGAVPDGNWCLVFERFNPHRQDHANYCALEIIAGVETLLHTPGGQNFIYKDYDDIVRKQEPGHAKSFVSDNMLRKWGWAWSVRSPHERDAIRHLGFRINEMMEGRF